MSAERNRTSGVAFAFFIALGVCGCSSVRSTHVERDPERCGWKTTHLAGVPTKIKVPTHLEIRIYEKEYATKDGEKLEYIAALKTVRVEHKFIEKEEIFTIDPVRPAAGLGYSSTTLNAKNSVASIKGKIDDQTIQAITYSIDKLTGGSATAPTRPTSGLPSPSTSASLTKKSDSVVELETLVAVRWFDLTDRAIEMQIHDFLRDRLNACHAPCPIPQVSGSAAPARRLTDAIPVWAVIK